MALIDITGQTFGYLTVIGRAEKPQGIKSRNAYWKCKCKCGKETIVMGTNLRSGNTKSCGCLQKEITSQMRFKDLSGQRFGKLLVIEPINRMMQDKNIKYKCLCDCGNETEVLAINLIKDFTKSCGCNWHNSYAVQEIKKLLDNFPLPYKTEVKEKINNQNYYWDFVINPNKQDSWIIEFDGEQHFHSGSEKGWNTKENLKKTHERDMIKNQYAFNNNLILIRIPYTHNNIILEDLDPHTSNFVVNRYNINKYYINNGFNINEN